MRFRTDFPGGNGKLLEVQETEYGCELSFIAESHLSEPQPLWFYFRLEEVNVKRVRIRLANSAQCLGDPLAWGQNRPVCRFEGQAWRRVEAIGNEYDGDGCLQTWFEVPVAGEWLEFAFCYPYTVTALQETLAACTAFRPSIIGYSGHARPIYRLANTTEASDCPGVYVLARQHAGEVTGSWMMDGMLRRLAGSAGTKCAWWLVPAVDADGVEEGHYGKDQLGGDFNRAWRPWFAGRTEVVAIERDMIVWKERTKPCLVLDLHSPGHDERTSYFVVGVRDNDDALRNAVQAIRSVYNAKLHACGLQEAFYHEHGVDNHTSAQNGFTVSEYAAALGVHGVTFECSYQGEPAHKDYGIEDYRRMGACMAEAIEEVVCRLSVQEAVLNG